MNETEQTIKCPRCRKTEHEENPGMMSTSKNFKCRSCRLEWSEIVNGRAQ